MGTGEYFYHFPEVGYYGCLKCRAVVARATSKERVEGGYASFGKYCVGNVACDMRVLSRETQFVVRCAKCRSNLGRLEKNTLTSTGDCLRLNFAAFSSIFGIGTSSSGCKLRYPAFSKAFNSS